MIPQTSIPYIRQNNIVLMNILTIIIYNGTATSFTAHGLEPLTFYRFRLIGYLGENSTTSQISVSATTGSILLPCPPILGFLLFRL